MSLEEFQDRWQQLDSLFHQALELPHAERERFCTTACGDDTEFRDFLRELVISAGDDDDSLQHSISELAQDVSRGKLLTGERVDRWQVGELLARGGMGEVYYASRADGEFEKNVIVKVLRQRLNRDEFIRHFKTEQQVHAALSHPYIPALIDAGQLPDGRPYLVAEFIDGTPIDEYCDNNRLSVSQRIALVETVCHAIAHAHSNLVLHLDIKPNNILIDKDGIPSLLDFGISRLAGEADTGHDAFTPEYASPEQLQGKSPSAASDIYALGGLLYCLLEGTPPFEAPRFSPRETKLAAREEIPAKIRQAAGSGNMGRELRAIIEKAMALAPADRYTSVSTLSLDLKFYRKNRPVSAMPRSFSYRLRKFLRRHALALSLGGAAFALLVALGWREMQLREETQLAYEKSEREAESARQVADFLVELFEVSDPRQARGEDVTARDLLAKGAARIDTSIDAGPGIKVRLLQTLGYVHHRLGLFDEAEGMYADALKLSRNSEPPDALATAETLNQLGDMLRLRDRLAEADTHLGEALRIRRELLPPGAEPLAHTLKQLGLLRNAQARYAEAEALLTEAAALYEEIDRSDDKIALRHALVMQNLGGTFHGQERLDEALEYYERASRLLRTRFGHDHPSALNSLKLITIVYREQGHYDKSERQLLEILRLLRKTFGEDHLRVTSVYNELGSTNHDLGRFEKAVRYYDKVIEIEKRTAREGGRGMATAINNKAWAYLDMENYGLAEPLFRQSLEYRQKLFGAQHPMVARAKYNLGSLCLEIGKYAEAERLLLDDMRIKKDTMPENGRLLERSWRRLGQIAHRRSDLDAAADYYTRALEAYHAKDMASHPRVAYLLYDLALLALDNDDPTAAVARLDRALRIQRARLPGDHPHTARTLALAGEARLRAGNSEQGRAELVAGAAGMRLAFSPDSPSLRRATAALEE